jgi:hypothetical protein
VSTEYKSGKTKKAKLQQTAAGVPAIKETTENGFNQVPLVFVGGP